MKILYFADLHGNRDRCKYSLELIKKLKPDVVVNGGDLLSIKGNPFAEQPKFIRWFENILAEAATGIPYLLIPGNDDLKAHLPLISKIEDRKLIINISGTKTRIGDYEFIGYSYIPNYHYMLKDWRKLDNRDIYDPAQPVQPVISKPTGYEPIDNLKDFLYNQTTIKQDMEALPEPEDYSKAIYVMHSPPAGTELDVANNGMHAGSKSIYEFIVRKHPLLTLHGHIHESPSMTGKHSIKINNTTCMHPGQNTFLSFNTEDLGNSLEIIKYN